MWRDATTLMRRAAKSDAACGKIGQAVSSLRAKLPGNRRSPMNRLAFVGAALALSGVAGCSNPPGPGAASMAQPAAYDYCRDFARGGGYPVLRGGSNGSNSLME